jgi:diadenosine tetraphosphate (Ap4A) HIT family hydrolase
MGLTPEEQKQQEFYRDARFNNQYDTIWKTVGVCAFCEPREKYIFYEENGIMMTISLYAYIDGHFLIVPRRHVRSVKEMTPLEWATVRKCMYIAKKLIRKVHNISGMQTILKEGATAQSTVGDHIHLHCVPFDAPDLSVWNYRKLQFTPLQNVALYKKQGAKIKDLAAKYDQKYKESDTA